MYAHGPKFYCFAYENGRWQAREVKAGATNDKFFVIKSGLHEGEQIAMNPRAYLEYVSLPKLPPEEIQRAVPQPPSATRTASNASKSNAETASIRPAGGSTSVAPASPQESGSGGSGGKRPAPAASPAATPAATTSAALQPKLTAKASGAAQ
jgi:HlyD family secretion protein